MSDKKLTIAVTGASGYIASWVVKKLLQHGYTVHATVRNVEDSEKHVYLYRLQVAHPGQLMLFEADLLVGGFVEAFEHCDTVIHMASPFLISGIKDPQKQLIDPALEGTRNVLSAVNNTPTVTQVVLTSSVVALYNDAVDISEATNKEFDDTCWNTTASKEYSPYNYSKTIAEKEAWKMNKAQSRWTLTTIHPGFVMGPSLNGRSDGASTQFMIQMLRGDFRIGAPEFYFGIVDVRDVAEAHIHAVEREHTPGRYIAVNEVLSMLQISEITQRVTESIDYPLPSNKLSAWMLYLFGPLRGISWKFITRNYGKPFAFDTSKAKSELGVWFRSTDETFRDMVLQLERDNLIR
ncbi:NAD-dependent epimerase/dehydratase family protein [Phaeocystidibacter marisrubri]|uniref:NAD-dependent epimerase/dehydratase family protein n=1 Tax=Phaeocystidibacter marisrubri TaxID=1577780 RepID=A0A6L3ZGF0_9FLAO|nr:NAD-dependent epimerase/dehydratase family protein [Phaeocystidibacter marisrubri]KAB2816497.1 NAD-dependent epimerase/dehydratase family protein [Phaeocystidibacter marisrubri]GGH69349.1 dihydroflavonol-4-reductase [Phaeocystidibacter marisrubri]